MNYGTQEAHSIRPRTPAPGPEKTQRHGPVLPGGHKILNRAQDRSLTHRHVQPSDSLSSLAQQRTDPVFCPRGPQAQTLSQRDHKRGNWSTCTNQKPNDPSQDRERFHPPQEVTPGAERRRTDPPALLSGVTPSTPIKEKR